MRSRILSKMTVYEVDEYLDRNDIIFIPVGPTEMHGNYPMEVEYVGPLGMALAMAEKVDGLVLDGLKYFYNGSCAIGKGTVRMSVQDGYNYLKAIAYSLLSQGFKRQIYITGHGTSELTLGSLVGDFFDETKQPIAWIDQLTTTEFAKTRLGKDICKEYNDFSEVTLGCYRISGNEEDLIIDPVNGTKETKHGEMFRPGQNRFQGLPESLKNISHIINFGSFAYSIGFYMGSINDHGGSDGTFASEEDRSAACERGLKQLLKVVDAVDMPLFVKQMRDQQAYTENVIKKEHGKYLPWCKAVPWVE